jgi:hypothetical protein
MTTYGATFDINQPAAFDRAQVFLRLLILVILAALAGALGWVYGALYLVIPVIAAVMISQAGPAAYISGADGNIIKWLHYLAGFRAYMYFLTDRFPDADMEGAFHFEIAPSGTPTPGSALLRIIYAIPSALVFFLLALLGLVLAVIAAVLILMQETYPAGIYGYLRGLLRWEVRLYAYLASLVEAYPPFAFDTGPEGLTPPSG